MAIDLNSLQAALEDVYAAIDEARAALASAPLPRPEKPRPEPVAKVIFTKRMKPDVEWLVDEVRAGTLLYAGAEPVARQPLTDRQAMILYFAMRWPDESPPVEAADRFIKHGASWAREDALSRARAALDLALGITATPAPRGDG